MLYCPSCNNTHWTPTKRTSVFALLRLKQELKCGKCGKLRLGSIFLDLGTAKAKDHSTHCPACKAKAKRSRRKGLERLLFFFGAYRCNDCKHRFYKLHLTK